MVPPTPTPRSAAAAAAAGAFTCSSPPLAMSEINYPSAFLLNLKTQGDKQRLFTLSELEQNNLRLPLKPRP